jgi:hypothetical protein
LPCRGATARSCGAIGPRRPDWASAGAWASST